MGRWPEEGRRPPLRRRSLLAGLAAGSVGVVLPRPDVAALAALTDERTTPVGRIVARQIDHLDPASVAEAVTPEHLTSRVIDAGQLFERVGAHFRAASGSEACARLEVRASADAALWTRWIALGVDHDMHDRETATHYLPPRAVPQDSRYVQYRVWLDGGRADDLLLVALTVIDASDLNSGPLARIAREVRSFLARDRGYALAAAGPSKILTRQDWGADESLMKWTPNYVTWQKAVVHHTVTDDGGSDVAAAIRSIYHFHAVTRGWGDIGYQFLVDKYGNIWTGRQGGDNVVAGHAFGWNDGAFAVAAIGDYTWTAPTSALQGAIANVIAMKFKQQGIQPFGSGAFIHHETQPDGSRIDVTTVVANVVAHRDCTYEVGKPGGQTSCPGDPIYNMLDGLRGLAQRAWDGGYTYLTRLDPQLPTGGFPGQQLTVPVLVRNLGATTVPAGTLVNYRVLRSGALVTQGAGAALAQLVAPGATQAVNVSFVAPPAGEYIVRWGLQSGSAWWSAVYNDPFRDTWFRAADWSAAWLTPSIPTVWTAGSTRILAVSVRNDGGRTWNASGTDPVRVGYYWISTLTGARIDGAVKMPLPYDVTPGQTLSLNVPTSAPVYPSSYTLVFDLYKENEFWFKDKGLRPDDTATAVVPDFRASYAIGTLPAFEAGKTATVPVTVRNAGNGTFPAAGTNPIRLSYHWMDAAGQTVVWDGGRTPLAADLLAGQTASLGTQVTAPAKGGAYSLRFDLVQEGVGWFSSKGVATANAPVNVAGPLVPVYGATYQPGVSTFALSGGVTAIPFTVKNTSNFTWPAGGTTPIDLGYHWLDSGGRVVVWEGLRTKLAADLAPGDSVTLQAQIAFPTPEGSYTLRWDMVHEGVSWFSGKGVPTFDQVVVIGPRYYGGSIDVSAVPATLAAGQTASVPLRVQNLSNFDWDSFVDLSYHWSDASGKLVVWDGARTPLSGIRVSEVRALNATVVAPTQSGAYTLRFDIVQEGVAWFSDQGMQLAPIPIKVEAAASGYGAEYSPQPSVSGAAGATVSVPIAVRNTGGLDWQPGVVNLAYHLYAPSGDLYVWDGMRTAFAQPVKVSQTVVLNAQARLPTTSGTYTIKWDLVQEGVTWFSGKGVPTGSSTLVVQ